MAIVVVHVPAALRELTGGRATVSVEATTLGEVLSRLRESEPLLSGRLFSDDGSIRGFVNLFLNGVDVRGLGPEATPITTDAHLSIVPSVAGG